jgi:hypothetical protein
MMKKMSKNKKYQQQLMGKANCRDARYFMI